MLREEFDEIARERPFKPLRVRLVDGRVYRFPSPELFIVSRGAVLTLDKSGDLLLINLGLIATVHQGNGSRRRRKT